MRLRISRLITLAGILAMLAGLLPAASISPAALAQGGGRYENTTLGVAFDLPAGWQVTENGSQVVAATAADLAAIEAGGMPQALVVRIIMGTFNELGITDATQLPELLTRLVASSVTPPPAEPVQWGNGSGYQMLVTLPDGLTTRVALLAISGGRVAVVRGLATSAAWDSGAGALFDSVATSLTFSLPVRDEHYMDQIPGNDGGVLWHYQGGQPESGRQVIAGGITYDMFDIMYMAAGPGGVMSLAMDTGNQISFIGPWYGGNFVDLAIGPDTKLYLANTAEETFSAVTVVDRAGNWLLGWGERGDGNGQFAPGMPQTIAVDRSGNVWTVSEGHATGIQRRLYKFDGVGNLLLTIDLAAINPDLSGIRIDNNIATGGLYLVGATGNINVIDSNGQPLVVNLAQEVLVGTTPIDIAVAPDNNLIIALASPGLDGYGLLELSVAGRLLDVFGIPLNTSQNRPFLPGEYLRPGGLIMGPDGTGYWTETNPANGYVQVQRFTFSGDGKLPLGSEMAGAVEAPDAAPAVDPAHGGGTILYGETRYGALNNRYPSHNWTFPGTAGDHIIISMVDTSGANLIDPKLVLKNSQGREIAENDDVGDVRPENMSRRDARIDFFLSETGVFTIVTTRFGGRGDYALTLEKVN